MITVKSALMAYASHRDGRQKDCCCSFILHHPTCINYFPLPYNVVHCLKSCLCCLIHSIELFLTRTAIPAVKASLRIVPQAIGTEQAISVLHPPHPHFYPMTGNPTTFIPIASSCPRGLYAA